MSALLLLSRPSEYQFSENLQGGLLLQLTPCAQELLPARRARERRTEMSSDRADHRKAAGEGKAGPTGGEGKRERKISRKGPHPRSRIAGHKGGYVGLNGSSVPARGLSNIGSLSRTTLLPVVESRRRGLDAS